MVGDEENEDITPPASPCDRTLLAMGHGGWKAADLWGEGGDSWEAQGSKSLQRGHAGFWKALETRPSRDVSACIAAGRGWGGGEDTEQACSASWDPPSPLSHSPPHYCFLLGGGARQATGRAWSGASGWNCQQNFLFHSVRGGGVLKLVPHSTTQGSSTRADPNLNQITGSLTTFVSMT